MAGWAKGQSGNLRGRPINEKTFAEALRLAVNEDDGTGRKRLRTIAEKLVEQAMAGEGWAIQQVADRLDGKPAQESTVTVEKRDVTDWSRAELVAVLNDARSGGAGTAKTNGRGNGTDQFH